MNEFQLFEAALGIEDPADRATMLVKECHGNERLRKSVESLLATHDAADGFMETPLSLDASNETPDGETTELVGMHGNPEFPFLHPSERSDSIGRIGDYEVLQMIGRGGNGIVFRAFDEKLHRVVALKVMAPELTATSPARKRFMREARSAASLQHASVVNIFSVEDGQYPFLTMEFIGGPTLQQKLDQAGPLEFNEAAKIGAQIAEGLSAAHSVGLLHRDIKPANILLQRGSGDVKITDFGLARAVDDASLTRSGMISGTPMFMSPEQAQGLSIDPRSDLFSLGSVLYVMLTGRPPFRAPNSLAIMRRLVDQQPRALEELIPDVPVPLVKLVSQLHEKAPQDRLESASKVADSLRSYLKGSANLDVTHSPKPKVLPKNVESAGDTIQLTHGFVVTAFGLLSFCVLLALIAIGVSAVSTNETAETSNAVEQIEVLSDPGDRVAKMQPTEEPNQTLGLLAESSVATSETSEVADEIDSANASLSVSVAIPSQPIVESDKPATSGSGTTTPFEPAISNIVFEDAKVRGTSVVIGVELSTLKQWFNDLGRWVPMCVNVRHGSEKVLFDAVAVNFEKPPKWHVSFVKNDREAGRDYVQMKGSHGVYWRTGIPAAGRKPSECEAIKLWRQPSANWSTNNFQTESLFSVITKVRKNNDYPRSISVLRSNDITNTHVLSVRQHSLSVSPFGRLALDDLVEREQHFRKENRRLEYFQLHSGTELPTYAAVFCENKLDRTWKLSTRLTETQFWEMRTARRKMGQYPRSIVSCQIDGKVFLTVLWLDAFMMPRF